MPLCLSMFLILLEYQIFFPFLPKGYQLPEQTFSKRMDFRKNVAFTIAAAEDCLNSDSGALNVAFSFDIVRKGLFLLGVHVVDVSHFVKKGTGIDSEAAERGKQLCQ